jgi:RNA polymerase sigma factor (sigma-70 family)
MVQGPEHGDQSGPDVLTAGTRRHDEAVSFDAFYTGEIAGLVSLAAGLCGRAAAEDVAQEAMLATYRRWHDVADRDHPEAFARKVCANIAVSTFRRRLVELRAVARLTDRSWARGRGESADPAPDDEFWTQVCRLPRRQAQAVALRYVYGLDVAAIADTLGLTAGTVKVHLYRGRQTLASRLGVDEEDRS